MPFPSSRARLLVALASLAAAAPAPTDASAQQAPQRPTCAAGEHRQFDFWVGAWRVESPEGRFLGTNQIVRSLGGCVLHEHWEGVGGDRGESFNLYDRSTGQWRQRWVSSTGTLLELDGGLREGDMVMEGASRGPGGAPILNRITWSRPEGSPGRVRQLWETSADGGQTWAVAFDGVYIREG